MRGRSNTGFTYPDGGSIEVNLQTTLNQITINHDVGMSPVFREPPPDNPRAAVARTVQLISDPGSSIRCTFRRNYRGVVDNVGCAFSGRSCTYSVIRVCRSCFTPTGANPIWEPTLTPVCGCACPVWGGRY